jgi:hypothetical protein
VSPRLPRCSRESTVPLGVPIARAASAVDVARCSASPSRAGPTEMANVSPAVLKEVDEDGYERHATIGVRPRKHCTTGPIIGARSASSSRRSVSNHPASTSGTTVSRPGESPRSGPRPDDGVAQEARRRLPGVIEQNDVFERGVARIEPWGAGDLPLLEQLNDPEMTKHVGGPRAPGSSPSGTPGT